MADLMLVHGAWHGAWCWRRVLPLLWGHGHRPHAVTLTGLGERRSQLRAGITLDTHITDVVDAVEAEEMSPVTLIGHSYAGMVITGAADRLLARGWPVSRLVYVDAIVPSSGETWSSGHDAATIAARCEAARAGGIDALPPPDASAFGLSGKDHAWVMRRQTPHPFAPYLEPLHFDAAAWRDLPRHFIDCVAPPLATIDASRARVRRQGGWVIHELRTGHDPMVSSPAELAALLARIAETG